MKVKADELKQRLEKMEPFKGLIGREDFKAFMHIFDILKAKTEVELRFAYDKPESEIRPLICYYRAITDIMNYVAGFEYDYEQLKEDIKKFTELEKKEKNRRY